MLLLRLNASSCFSHVIIYIFVIFSRLICAVKEQTFILGLTALDIEAAKRLRENLLMNLSDYFEIFLTHLTPNQSRNNV